MNLANDSISATKSQLHAAISRRNVFTVGAIGVLTAGLILVSLSHSDTNAVTEQSATAIEQPEASAATPVTSATSATSAAPATASTADVDFTSPIVDYTYN